MNQYLIFRTDRIGDFLLSAILIKSIKRNDPNAFIKVVASESNFDYIKTFKIIDEVLLFKRGFLNIFQLINKLKKNKYHSIILHDSKNRSNFISFFLKSKNKIFSDTQSSYFLDIKKILNLLNFKFDDNDLNILENRSHKKIDLPQKFILLHFDEKWIHSEYILKYSDIEPDKNQLLSFLNTIVNKTNKSIIITTGLKTPKILIKLFETNLNPSISLFEDQDFADLENIINKSDLLISCHGAVSHVASANNIIQIDIIEESQIAFYKKWTHHFRNYNYIFRKNFEDLSKDIYKFL